MKHFLCLTLLLLIALPTFAQDGPPVLGQALPNDPALLIRMQDQLRFELQETQRMLNIINPNDAQLIETLRTRQAELGRQINDIVGQLQTSLATPNVGAGFPGADARPGLMPGLPPMQQRQAPDWRQAEPAMPPGMGMPGMQGMPMPPEGMMGGMPPGMPMPGMHGMPMPPENMMPGGMIPGGQNPVLPNMPFNPADVMPNHAPQWGITPPPDWEAAQWGPRLPRELTEMRQSIESLQREISSLRDTVRQLETQIQLLNRNILLNDRANERMNEWMIERMGNNGE